MPGKSRGNSRAAAWKDTHDGRVLVRVKKEPPSPCIAAERGRKGTSQDTKRAARVQPESSPVRSAVGWRKK